MSPSCFQASPGCRTEAATVSGKVLDQTPVRHTPGPLSASELGAHTVGALLMFPVPNQSPAPGFCSFWLLTSVPFPKNPLCAARATALKVPRRLCIPFCPGDAHPVPK